MRVAGEPLHAAEEPGAGADALADEGGVGGVVVVDGARIVWLWRAGKRR